MKTSLLLRTHFLLVVFLVLSSCTKGSLVNNHIGTQKPEWVLERLYFGREIPQGGQVSEQAWCQFVDEVVTPRFPEGFTMWWAEGQWRDALGAIMRESTYVLELAHSEGKDQQIKLKEIIEAYKYRFRQESVLRITESVQIEF